MMLALIRDVAANGIDIGWRNAESAIPGLPCEFGVVGALGLDPFRRCLFRLFDHVADGCRAIEFEQYVHVVFNRIDQQRGTTQVLEDGSHVSMQCIAELVAQPRRA